MLLGLPLLTVLTISQMRHRLADSGGDISQLRKESRMLSRLKRRAGRLESLRSRENSCTTTAR